MSTIPFHLPGPLRSRWTDCCILDSLFQGKWSGTCLWLRIPRAPHAQSPEAEAVPGTAQSLWERPLGAAGRLHRLPLSGGPAWNAWAPIPFSTSTSLGLQKTSWGLFSVYISAVLREISRTEALSSCTTIVTNSRALWSPPKETPYLLAVTPHSTHLPAPGSQGTLNWGVPEFHDTEPVPPRPICLGPKNTLLASSELNAVNTPGWLFTCVASTRADFCVVCAYVSRNSERRGEALVATKWSRPRALESHMEF